MWRLCHAKLLELIRATRQAVLVIQIGLINGIDMPRDKRTRADIGPDQSGVHMHDIARDDPRALAIAHHPHKDRPKPLRAPTLPDPGQGGMIRQRRGMSQVASQSPQTSGSPDGQKHPASAAGRE